MSGKSPGGMKVLIALVGLVVLFAALLFIPAGRLDWGAGWLYLFSTLLYISGNYLYLNRYNPELIEHRMHIGKGTKSWDKWWLAVFTLLFMAVYVVAAADGGRYGWSRMESSLWFVGVVLFVGGAILVTWAMGVNPFFEKTVRIQTERSHHVIDTGPYQYVRHPGYAGFFGWILGAPLMLESWWAFVPAVLCLLAVFIRTQLEDRTLKAELPGYAQYIEQVRYRLIPGIW